MGNFRVDFEADGLVFNGSSKELAAQLALGVRDIVQQQIKHTGVQAAPATIAKRERARKNAGKSVGTKRSRTRDWYRWRYSGGRVGETPPLVGRTELFMDSGRMADNLALNPRVTSTGESVVTMNVPANRLNRDSFAHSYQFADMIRKMKLYVPMLGGGALSGKSATEFQGLIKEISGGAISLEGARTSALLARRRAAAFRALKALGGFAS